MDILYGALITSLFSWRDLSSELGPWGFEPKLYDSCVVNKTADGKHCTIFWNMDDMKILHMISKVVDGVLSQLTAKYGNISALSVSQGRVHDYLGMKLDSVTKCKVRITMPKHI